MERGFLGDRLFNIKLYTMKKEAINTIKDTFEANPQAEQFFANEFGHCFKSGGEGLTLVKRDEVDNLVADEDAEAKGEDGNEGGDEGKGKGNRKKK